MSGAEIPLSSVHLTTVEASGETRVRYGLTPERSHQPPRSRLLPSWHVAYVHPPLPSSHHPWPRRMSA